MSNKLPEQETTEKIPCRAVSGSTWPYLKIVSVQGASVLKSWDAFRLPASPHSSVLKLSTTVHENRGKYEIVALSTWTLGYYLRIASRVSTPQLPCLEGLDRSCSCLQQPRPLPTQIIRVALASFNQVDASHFWQVPAQRHREGGATDELTQFLFP